MSSIDRARGVVDELNQTVVVDSIRTVIVDRRLISRWEHWPLGKQEEQRNLEDEKTLAEKFGI
jgi:hypothetical protein